MEHMQYSDIYLKIKLLCTDVAQNPKKCTDQMRELQDLLLLLPTFTLQRMLPTVLCVAYPIFKTIYEDTAR